MDKQREQMYEFMASTGELAEFLHARLDEDEQTALEWQRHKQALTEQFMNDPRRQHVRPRREPVTNTQLAKYAFNSRFDPARVLREVEAKRQTTQLHSIVHRQIGWLEDGDEEHAEIPVCRKCVPKHSYYERRADVPEGPCLTARLLALPYAYHKDYQEKWRP